VYTGSSRRRNLGLKLPSTLIIVYAGISVVDSSARARCEAFVSRLTRLSEEKHPG